MSLFSDVIKQRAAKADLALENLAAQTAGGEATENAGPTSDEVDVTVGAPVVPADGGEPVAPTPEDATPPVDDTTNPPAIAPESTPTDPVDAAAKTDPNDMSVAATATASTLRVRKSPAMRDIAQVYQTLGSLDQKSAALTSKTRTLETVSALKTVLSEQPLSQPLVAALEALPGFSEIAPNFPGSNLFNVIHEPKVSANQQLGLESLSLGETSAFAGLTASAVTIGTSFEAAIESIGVVATTMKARFEQDLVAFAESDITDEVMADLSVVGLAQTDMSDLLTQLTVMTGAVAPFNADEMRSHPQNLAAEVTALSDVVEVGGPILGIKLSDSGLVSADKDARFVASAATLGERGVTREGIEATLNQGVALCDHLIAMAEQKDDLVSSLATEAQSVPTTLSSDDVTFGALDHVALMQSYVGLASATVRETMNALSLVQGLADVVLDLGDGGSAF